MVFIVYFSIPIPIYLSEVKGIISNITFLLIHEKRILFCLFVVANITIIISVYIFLQINLWKKSNL